MDYILINDSLERNKSTANIKGKPNSNIKDKEKRPLNELLNDENFIGLINALSRMIKNFIINTFITKCFILFFTATNIKTFDWTTTRSYVGNIYDIFTCVWHILYVYFKLIYKLYLHLVMKVLHLQLQHAFHQSCQHLS